MLRIQRTLTTLEAAMKKTVNTIDSVWWIVGDFKTYDEIVAEKKIECDIKTLPFYFQVNNARFAFGQTVNLPTFDADDAYFIEVSTGREGQWDAVNPQMLVYLEGEVVCGLDTNHRMVYLDAQNSGKSIEFVAHIYTGMSAGDLVLRLKLVKVNQIIKRAYYDLRILHEVIIAQQADSQNVKELKRAVDDAIYAVNFGPNEENLINGAQSLSTLLRENCYGDKGLLPYTVHAVGHTHIDVAWLWDLRQTREKVARSYATALNLQSRYPFYQFMASQPVLYEMLEAGHPELLTKIQSASEQGIWESEGAMYLEADCNLSGGESLIRQIEHGQRYFKEKFGAKSKGLWLPDVFGYSAALPQILKLSGIEWFVTSKISWNDTNKLPFDSFLWKGIDESVIPTQFITTISMETLNKGEFKSIYEGNLTATEVLGSVRRHQQSDIQPNVIMPYGYGDGGGGATESMLESLERFSMGIKGMPRVISSNVNTFFKAYHQTSNEKLPIWSGELYLEYHRGTYTTNGQIKQKHRTLENRLIQLEKLHAFHMLNRVVNAREKIEYSNSNAMTNTLSNSDRDTYSRAKFEPIDLESEWRTLLLNEFHDILPGTSIEEVYVEAYAQLDAAIASVDDKIQMLLNQLSHSRSEYYIISSSEGEYSGSFLIRDDHGLLNDNGLLNERIVLNGQDAVFERIDALYWCGYIDSANKLMPFEIRGLIDLSNKDSDDLLPNALYRETTQIKFSNMESTKVFDFENYNVTFNVHGDITSLFDKNSQRSILKEDGQGLRLNAYEDRPLRWDAWDIDIDYRKSLLDWDEQVDIEHTKGKIADKIKITKTLSASTMSQTYVFYHEKGNNRLDMTFDVDWHHHQVLLKLEGDFEIHAPFATYDIQFGQVNRPNDFNTTYHQAMFEVCAQHFGKLTEDNYSITLMSNDKFGYHAYQNQMGITLLKSPNWPNPNSDQGRQQFSVALLCGNQQKSSNNDTYKEAIKFCEPPRFFKNDDQFNRDNTDTTNAPSAPVLDWFELPANMTLESMRIKSSNCIEIRLCERYNKRGTFKLKQYNNGDTLRKYIKTCHKMDLKGECIYTCIGDEMGYEIPYRPFEIITLNLYLEVFDA